MIKCMDMTLATHIIIAAAVTKSIAPAHPLLIFTTAIITHYLSDAIPHWDYSLSSIDSEVRHEERKWNFRDPTFLRDIRNIAFDAFLGTALVALIASPASSSEFLWLFLTAAGAVLPDFLQGVYFTRRADFLRVIHHFHGFMHSKIALGPYPLIGIPFQAIIFLTAFASLLGN